MSVTLCVLLWANPGHAGLLTEYESQVLALVPRHGGRVVSRVRNVASDNGQPTEVQVIEMPDDQAIAAYSDDPDRTSRLDVRDLAIAHTEIIRVEPVD